MVTDKGEFKFLHSRDFWDMCVANKVVYPDGSLMPCTVLPDGRTVELVVSDHETKGGGLQDEPHPGTIKSFSRHARDKGLPLPWEKTITYDQTST